MQGSGGPSPTPEAILDWLQKEMGYRYVAPLPSPETLEKICRGNMIPIWNFLLQRVKSEKTVRNIRRNILVHGNGGGEAAVKAEEGRSRGRRVKAGVGSENATESRERAMRERELAEEEVERLRHVARRQRKDVRARMLEVAREESERKRMLDEKAGYRHKQVMLEAYDQQCEESVKIFTEYLKHVQHYVDQAKDANRTKSTSAHDTVDIMHANSEKRAIYSGKGSKSADEITLRETAREKNIGKACEALANHMIGKICNIFPAYEGRGVQTNTQSDAAKLNIDFDGELPDDVRAIVLHELKSPIQLLQAMTLYTSRMKTLINKETEKIDVRADAELLRYKYENNKVMEAPSPDSSLRMHYQAQGNEKIRLDVSAKSTSNQLVQRQRAHVQQFLATEDALNKASEARNLCEQLLKRLHGSVDGVAIPSFNAGASSQNVGSLRHLELEVWAKEREAIGLRAGLHTLTCEVQRLQRLCEEWKEAEESLRKKWKRIEEFDARRSELEVVYTWLLRANMDAAAFWTQQPAAAKHYAFRTIIPACKTVAEKSCGAKDLIEKEVSAFGVSPDNRLYMLPSTPQALLESMGVSGSAGPEAFAAAEKNAALLTARAGLRDPSSIPSICRVSAALQYHSGLEGSDAALASVLESLESFLKLRGSEASVLENLSNAINRVHIHQDLVDSGRSLLTHAHRAKQEYERTTGFSVALASEQEKTVTEKWLPELKNAVWNAHKCLEDCKRVRGLVDEWWEQPAATVVDWITVDGQNVAAWVNHVKQLQTPFYGKALS